MQTFQESFWNIIACLSWWIHKEQELYKRILNTECVVIMY
jgi:hypothetical protein